MKGYEIHLGRSTPIQPIQSFVQLDDGRQDGVYTKRVIGTYYMVFSKTVLSHVIISIKFV